MLPAMARRILWLVALALAGGCERRVEEPAGSPREAGPAGFPSAAPASSSHATARPKPPSSAPTAERCIDPTPAEPPRKVDPGPHPACPDDPGRPQLRWGRAVFEDAGVIVGVEIADDDATRQRGLMYRKALADLEGMVFVMEKPKIQRFWMKNCCIPLDMLFVDGDGFIVGIAENVPFSEDPTAEEHPTFFVRCPSQYVIEVGAGWSRRHNVRAGQRVRLEGL
jgi:uncharacterized protein